MIGEGTMLMWFVLTGLSLLFVSVDIARTPAHPVLKWAFVILTVFTGPFAAFFYVLGCREPLKGTHATYVATRWRQVLGSTMHCAARVGFLSGVRHA
jgi:type IV secretory pathway VirB2 component (pilin)